MVLTINGINNLHTDSLSWDFDILDTNKAPL